jgi:uncharacterized protein YjbJ (UPF0337 family)
MGTALELSRSLIEANMEGQAMDKDRVKGMAQQGKGAMKEAAGKVMGDEKLKAEGKMDKIEGKVRNAVGGMKDAVRDADRH